MKRMTLLAKKEGLSRADFRQYWAGPHARLALGMEGIPKYRHNRIDKTLWTCADRSPFDVDGIVELYFSNAEAMRAAQASKVGRAFIPADELLFLKGWTLCVVASDGTEPIETTQTGEATKVLIPFHAEAAAREALRRDLSSMASPTSHAWPLCLDWTQSTARRPLLWTEPRPPTGFIAAWFASVADAHEAFEPETPLRKIIEAHATDATAYLVDVLTIR